MYIFICQLAFALFKKRVGRGAEKRGRMRKIIFMRMRGSMRAKGWVMAGQVSDLEVCCWAYEAQTGRLRSALAENTRLLNKKDSHERTALHWACVSGQIDIVKLLISLGAEVRYTYTYICLQSLVVLY